MSIRLLALDLDGTLYRHDGTISQWDIEAVARARAAGIVVTIATGRIALGALPAARALALDTHLVCAEGAVIVDAVTGDTIEHRPMELGHVEWLIHNASAHGLASFWFLHDEIHGEEQGDAHLDYIRTWSPTVTMHHRLQSSPAWEHRAKVTMTVAVGEREAVHAARAFVEREHPEKLLTVSFPMDREGTNWTLLVRDLRVDKATGLDSVSRRLGITASEVAVVGDWVNDIPMFRWAGRSFAMGQSPEHVASQATDRLASTHRTGGGVAEAILRILRDQ